MPKPSSPKPSSPKKDSVNEFIRSALGSTKREPGWEYGNVLPVRMRKNKQGEKEREWGLGYSNTAKSMLDAFTLPRRAMEGEEVTPEQAMEMAMNVSAPGVATARYAPGVLNMPTVYHGTPHKFEPTPDNPLGEFRASQIGTGEGAQKMAASNAEDIPEKEGYLRLYHGGHDSGFEQVPKGGTFDGFFASVGKVRGHGSGHNYFADIPEHKILTNYDLNYELPYKKVLDVFSKITKIKENDPEFESAWKAIIEETSDADELALSAGLADDYAEASMVAQKMRGQIAKQLGYDAVEMQDEHGTSYLISPGVSLKYIGEAEK